MTVQFGDDLYDPEQLLLSAEALVRVGCGDLSQPLLPATCSGAEWKGAGARTSCVAPCTALQAPAPEKAWHCRKASIH